MRLFALRGGSAPLGGRLAFAIGSPLIEQLLVWNPALRRKHELVAVRTQFLDKAIEDALPLRQQFVIVGAGLDSRPFRMRDALLETSTFEVDFPGMLSAKRQLFRSSGFDYDKLLPAQEIGTGAGGDGERGRGVWHVGVDLSLEGWQSALIAKGFDSTKPAIWLLEGFTGYLTEAELLALLRVISHLSAASSRLAATWLTPGGEHLSMHRFTTRNPTHILEPFGWAEVQVQTLQQAASSIHADAPPPRGGVGEREERRGDERRPDLESDVRDYLYLLSCHEKR